MIVLFTDFGMEDLYVGQAKAALLRHVPGATIIDLLHQVPNFDARAGAHLLAALQGEFDPGSVFLAVVDAGVGSRRAACVLQADGKWYLGPDNGLLSVVAARSSASKCWHITWRPERLSHSFHGRDLFAPIAALIAGREFPHDKLEEIPGLQVQFGASDLAEIIYLDHYGNALTGLRVAGVDKASRLRIGAHTLGYARVFSDVPAGEPCWYENSVGLVEIAVNCGSAAAQLGLQVGQPVNLLSG